VPEARPAESLIVTAKAVFGGRIELEWLYDPAYEHLGPGAAYEARIYWDADAGLLVLAAAPRFNPACGATALPP